MGDYVMVIINTANEDVLLCKYILMYVHSHEAFSFNNQLVINISGCDYFQTKGEILVLATSMLLLQNEKRHNI